MIVYLGRDKTMQLLEELVGELQLTEPVSSGVTHMDNPPYYRITSSYKVPSVTSGESHFKMVGLVLFENFPRILSPSMDLFSQSH